MKPLHSFGAILVATVMVHGAPFVIEPSASPNKNVAPSTILDSILAPDVIGGYDPAMKNTDGEGDTAKRGLGSLFGAIAKAAAKEAAKETAKEGVEQGADALSQQGQVSEPDVETRSLRDSSSNKSNKGNGGGSSWALDIAAEKAVEKASTLMGETAGEEDPVEKRAPRGGHRSGGGHRKGGGSKSGHKSSGGGPSSSSPSSSDGNTDFSDISSLGEEPKNTFGTPTIEISPSLVNAPIVNSTYISKVPIRNATPAREAK
ncbi:hypothetical protein VMCG_01316 [Cytospora schulzeri]|uniref:SMP domain-containing protein n=1 Tax=Cytospora schulzeri TaxID=448051 RepID=A0A423X6H6_9PEZI|nr:hypothetical protein VMCG_01316 [Valsa malicola]